MIRLIEKWYVLFMMLRIAKHNAIRQKFVEKYKDVFEAAGEDLEHMTLGKYYEKDKALYKREKDGKEYEVASKPQEDDFGLYEYADNHYDSHKDDYYGTVFTRTPLKNFWLKRNFTIKY